MKRKYFFSLEKKGLIFIFLLLLFIGDTVYTYRQHSLAPIDGDFPSLIAPSDAYQQVLHDPFGFKIVQTGKNHAASNRFFVHGFAYVYFRSVPLFVQYFQSPIDSVYTSITLIKTGTQIGLILILAAYVALFFKWKRNEYMLAAIVITPLFQAVGFFEYMTFIDNCITYVLFYALPALLLLIFLFPYYKSLLTGHSGLPKLIKPVWLLFAVILTFSGPLMSPVLLIICTFTLLYFACVHYQLNNHLPFIKRIGQSVLSINRQLLFSFGFIILLCIYSLYIGTHNSENTWETLSIMERYTRLTEGLLRVTSFSEGLMPIVLASFCNLYILQRNKNADTERIMKLCYILLLFSVVYLLLLPFGGYRSYRPYIIRRDTLQPLLCVLFFVWGLSTVYILKNARSTKRIGYAIVISIICMYYTFSDKIPDYTNT